MIQNQDRIIAYEIQFILIKRKENSYLNTCTHDVPSVSSVLEDESSF